MNGGYQEHLFPLDGTEQQDYVLARAIKGRREQRRKLIIGHVIDSTGARERRFLRSDLVQRPRRHLRTPSPSSSKRPRLVDVRGRGRVRAGRIRETLKDEMLSIG